MTIVICGSIKFYDDFLKLGIELEKLGHKVVQPEAPSPKSDSAEFFKDDGLVRRHMDKIALGDAVLIPNYQKNNIEGYIGPNTLMEIAVAFYLKKKIYLLNPVPESGPAQEIMAVEPIILKGELDNII